MATIQELEDALVRAHEAEDYEAAQIIADEIRAVQSGQPSGGEEAYGFGQFDQDLGRLVGNAVTFNLADKLAAMGEVGPIDYFSEQGDVALAKQRNETQKSRDRIRKLGGGTWATIPDYIPLMGGAEIGLDSVVDTAAGAALGGGLAKGGYSLLTSNAGRAAGPVGRIGRAMTEGAGYGAAYNVGSTDTGNVPDYFWNGVKGARDGALVGGGFQAAGQTAVGAGRSIAKNVRRATGRMNEMDRSSTAGRRIVGEAMADDGITSANAQQYGPETMLADNGVATRSLMRGAVQRPSPEANQLRRTLTDRADRRSQRLQSDVNQEFGPVTEYPDVRTRQLVQELGTISPRLQQVFASGQVDARGVLASVRAMLRTAEGPQQSALRRVERMLVEQAAQPAIPARPATPDRWVPDPNNPMMQRFVPGSPGRPGRAAVPERVKTNPEQLHNIKVTMDGMIDYGDPANGIPAGSVRQKDGGLRTARRNLFGQLDSQLQGYNRAMDDYRLIRRRMDAVQTGRDALDKGKGAMRPDQLRAIRDADGGNAANDLRIGMRGRVDELVGTTDEMRSLRSTLGGEFDWNREKLADNFGRDRVDNVVRAVDREEVFNATRDAGFGGSRSIENAAADQALQRAAPNRMIRLVDVPFRVLDFVAERVAGARSKNINREVARITGLQGRELTNFVRQMERRSETNRKVGRNTAMAVPGLLSGNQAFITDANGVSYDVDGNVLE
jgi:hypothetical protein